MIMVTHDPKAAEFARRTLHLDKGEQVGVDARVSREIPAAPLAALLRKKTRTLLTLLSVVAAFALFGMLDAVRVAFDSPQSMAGIDRLIISSRLSLIQPLPFAYLRPHPVGARASRP